MKILKILGAILLILLIVFFLAGLVKPDMAYELETTVQNPLEETFAIFNDETKLMEWMPAIKNIETIEKKPGIVGTKTKMTIDDQSKKSG